MARKRTSGAEDLIEVTSRFPWWWGVVAALVAFVVLRVVAGLEVPAPSDPKQIGGVVIRQAIKVGAMFGQWLVPALLLIGAAVSFLKQRRRTELHADVAKRKDLAPFAALTWQDFERVVGEYFHLRGFAVAETGGAGADGGVDLVLARGADRYLVQCKQWRAMRVGVEPVRELYGVISAQRAAGGFVVTSGTFTEEAKRFADGREIELVEGSRLAKLIQQQAGGKQPVPPAQEGAAPVCPKCSSPMVLRTARKGSNAGSEFWGCTRYPECRGTRPA